MPRPRHLTFHALSVAFRFFSVTLLLGITSAIAAPRDRITRPLDSGKIAAVPGHLNHLAQPQFDRGAVAPALKMNYMVLLVKPSAAQQSDLDQLLADQQNPSSTHFHEWLSPQDFGNRLGLSTGDESKVVAWLTSAGFNIERRSEARNWIAFSGTAGQVETAFHTAIHQFQIGAESHFSNTSEPAVPEALTDVVGGFLGLNDFQLTSMAKPVPPDYNTGGSHFLAPEDFATIYNLTPLYAAGIDGTGQNIVIVGQSDVLVSDLRAFRTRYNLPAKDPIMLPYTSTDPGLNGAQIEGNLDLEWAGAVAPNATIYYVYGPSAITAIVLAVELNIAPVISISYGGCEVDYAPSAYRAIAQQANAQGITILAASGDSGAAGCDGQSAEPFATRGQAADFPVALPEVTGVGGTQFAEGTGTYWAATNDPVFGSALSYIPEAAWNESGTIGLGASGGGISLLYPKPAWQAGPGVPNDTARHVPDIALSAALHDAYYINFNGTNGAVGGTSASAPSMAGIIALLNQYEISKGFQKKAGLGNINPQLYRLAQSSPAAFHDTTSGNNVVPCAQGSPDCAAGSFGYQTGTGYDMATGLGSVDANALLTNWNGAASGVVVTLSSNVATATVNDTVQLTATVAPAVNGGTPTGTVSFAFNTDPLGTVALTNGNAVLTIPLYQLAIPSGTATIAAQYSGDSSYSSGGATRAIRVTIPTGSAAIIPTAPNTVWPNPPDAQGLNWQAGLSLSEVAGVPALITGFTVDGQAQTLSQYFPSAEIPPSSTVSTTIMYRNLAPPLSHTYGFTGVDAKGNAWSRQITVNFLPLPPDNFFSLTATPLTVTQNTAADPSCQWAVQLNVDDLGGYGVNLLSSLFGGYVNLSSKIPSIFGTPRLDAWGDLQGTLCFGGITPPASNAINVGLSDGASFNVVVSFAGPPANPSKLSTAPSSVSLAASATQPAQSVLAVNLSDPTQTWSASIFPANRTTAWLHASQLSGTGTSQITLTASGVGFEPGVYRATIVLQSANAIPQVVNVPVMFVLGGSSTGTAITRVGNAASDFAVASPGMLLNVFGSKLANSTTTASGNPLAYSTAGVSATVNGLAAPVLSTSSGQLTIEVPYTIGAGPAVLGINNNGQIAGFPIQVAASSPGIYADPSGNLTPLTPAAQGGYATLFVNGTGEITPALKTAFSPAPTSLTASLPKPVLPLSVTVAGIPAFVQFAGIPPGLVGTMQINIIVPTSVPLGNQAVVVTVGGVSSPPVNVRVTAPLTQPVSSQ